MSTTTRCASRLILTLAVLALLVPSAWAFYPFGFFSTVQNGELVIVKWPLSAFDTNGDGDVSVAEGLELNFEVGNGADGFDAVEAAKVEAGLTEWELVSTAYAAFRRGQNITDPVELTAGLDSIDAFNVVTFESEDDAAGGGVGGGGSLAVILIANSLEDTFVTIGNTTVPVTGGRMIDIDSIITQASRDLEAQQSGTLKGTSVFVGGFYLSIGYSPLSNIDEEASELAGVNVENRVVAIRNFDGTIGLRGVTSSMYNDLFNYDDGGNNFIDSTQDLAPTDIAALTFIYPRENQDLFFDLNQRARTQANANTTSQPIAGAWIRAWCDTDSNPATARVPMFDTLTGLYYNGIDANFSGHFKLKGLFKELETINEQTFTASYVVSCSEFLPLVQGGDQRSSYDSTHGGFNNGTPGAGAISFDTFFPAEVFNENGNLLGLSSVNQGTPLVFDLATRKIVSQVSGKTLDVILATGRPMFGDANQTCPLNVIVGEPVDGGDGGGGGGGGGDDDGPFGKDALVALRAFRDDTLLGGGVGVAVTDAYYRLAPSAAEFFLSHERITNLARACIAPAHWIVVHAEWLLLISALILASSGIRGRMFRARMARRVVAVLALAFAFFAADARMLPYELSDYLSQSDAVITGKVADVESRWINNNTNIITDIAITVDTVIKGDQNSGGVVHLQLPTGRVGAIGRTSPQLPTFSVGEEVLVFLNEAKNGFSVYGGIAGKYLIAPHPRTGEKYLFATSLPGHTRLEREIAKMNQEKAPDGVELANTRGPMKIDFEHRTLVKLDDFVDYLRSLNKRQEKQTVGALKTAE